MSTLVLSEPHLVHEQSLRPVPMEQLLFLSQEPSPLEEMFSVLLVL